MTEGKVNPNLERGAATKEKLELYMISLCFAVLAVSVQTAQFGRGAIPDWAELLGWVVLLVSGLVGLWRMEYVPVTLQNFAALDRLEGRLSSLNEAKRRGTREVFLEAEDQVVGIDELIKDTRDAIARGKPVVKGQERSIFVKYFVHRYSMVGGFVLLMVSRGYEPVCALLGRCG
jgi:hypothetical protein